MTQITTPQQMYLGLMKKTLSYSLWILLAKSGIVAWTGLE